MNEVYGKEKMRDPESIAKYRESLDRKAWWNWFMLAGLLILVTIGLSMTIIPLVHYKDIRMWPWDDTEFTLVFVLSLAVLMVTLYLTYQQRQILKMNVKLQQIRQESQEHCERRSRILYAITAISEIMGAQTGTQSIFDYITRLCVETFGSCRASLMLLDKDTMELVIKSVHGRSPKQLVSMRQKYGEGISGWVAANRTSVLLGSGNDSARYPQFKFDNPAVCSAMVAPIIIRDELVGVLNVSNENNETRYDEEDLKTLEIFAKNTGTCIRHMEHVEWLRQMVPYLRQKNRNKDRSTVGK